MVSARRLKAIFALTGVFLLGSIAGAASSWAIAQRDYKAFVSGDRDAFEQRKIEALSRELDLNSEQREKIQGVFASHRDERRELQRSMFERCGAPLREHRTRIDADIRSVLLPEQQVRYDALVKEHENRFKAGK